MKHIGYPSVAEIDEGSFPEVKKMLEDKKIKLELAAAEKKAEEVKRRKNEEKAKNELGGIL